MTRRLYAVVSGSYSDYRILALFDSQESAAKWADTVKVESEKDDTSFYDSDARIESFPFYAGSEQPGIVTTYRAEVTLFDDGRVLDYRAGKWDEAGEVVSRGSKEWSHDAESDSRPRLRYCRAPRHNGKAGRLEGHGLDERALIQAISDRVAMFKAGAWDPRKRTDIEWTGGEDPS